MTTTQTTRPTDPSKISFSADCFEQVGTETFYVVALSAPKYPVKFDSKEEAEAFARVRNRVVQVRTRPVMRRIKWF